MPKFKLPRIERRIGELENFQKEGLRDNLERLEDGDKIDAWPTKGRYIERFKQEMGWDNQELVKIADELQLSQAAWRELLAELARDPEEFAWRAHTLFSLQDAHPQDGNREARYVFGESLARGLLGKEYGGAELDMDRTFTTPVKVDGAVLWPNSIYNDREIFPEWARFGLLDVAEILGSDIISKNIRALFAEAREPAKRLDKAYIASDYRAISIIHKEICSKVRGIIIKVDEREFLRVWLTAVLKNLATGGLVRQRFPRWAARMRNNGIGYLAVKSGAESRMLNFLVPLEELNLLFPQKMRFARTFVVGSPWNFAARDELDIHMMVGPPKSVSILDVSRGRGGWVSKFKDSELSYLKPEEAELVEPFSARLDVAAGNFVLKDGYLQIAKPAVMFTRRPRKDFERALQLLYAYGDSWSDTAMMSGEPNRRMIMITPAEKQAELQKIAESFSQPLYLVEDFEDSFPMMQTDAECKYQHRGLLGFGPIAWLSLEFAALRELEDDEKRYAERLERLVADMNTMPRSRYIALVDLARAELRAIKSGVSERPLRAHPLYKREEGKRRILEAAYKLFENEDAALIDRSPRLKLKWVFSKKYAPQLHAGYIQAPPLEMRDVYRSLAQRFVSKGGVDEIERWVERIYGRPMTSVGDAGLLHETLDKNLAGFNSALGGEAIAAIKAA